MSSIKARPGPIVWIMEPTPVAPSTGGRGPDARGILARVDKYVERWGGVTPESREAHDRLARVAEAAGKVVGAVVIRASDALALGGESEPLTLGQITARMREYLTNPVCPVSALVMQRLPGDEPIHPSVGAQRGATFFPGPPKGYTQWPLLYIASTPEVAASLAETYPGQPWRFVPDGSDAELLEHMKEFFAGLRQTDQAPDSDQSNQ